MKSSWLRRLKISRSVNSTEIGPERNTGHILPSISVFNPCPHLKVNMHITALLYWRGWGANKPGIWVLPSGNGNLLEMFMAHLSSHEDLRSLKKLLLFEIQQNWDSPHNVVSYTVVCDGVGGSWYEDRGTTHTHIDR